MRYITLKFRIKDSSSKRRLLKSPSFLTTGEILKDFERLNYASFGFGAAMIWRICGKNEVWEAALRNDQNWKEPKPEFSGNTFEEALNKLHNYCIEKGYI